MTEMGEFVVGAYLRMVNGCTLIVYNQKPFEEKGKFEEIDVIGINPSEKKIYLCGVVTHLRGMLYSGGNKETLRKLKKKFKVVKKYSESIFPDFRKRIMLWSPYVPKGILTKGLEDIQNDLKINIELVINEVYTRKIDELRDKAKEDTKDRGEPFYRALQILEHLRN